MNFRTKTLLIMVLILIAAGYSATANDSLIAGEWEGSLNIRGYKLGFSCEFMPQDTTIEGTMDIPKQNAHDLPLQNIYFDGDSLYFEYDAPIGLAKYSATYNADNEKLSGNFTQNKIDGSFTLGRPVIKPLPYVEEEVTLELDDVILSGTLTLPDRKHDYPAVLLITGSGAQNRDEEIQGFRPFWHIADEFAKMGIAVLRFDDPGIGKSEIKGDTLDYSMLATTEDFTRHAAKSIKFLKKQDNIDKKKIGVLGHSEGGIIAAELASNMKDVSFSIMLATPAQPGSTVILNQIETYMTAQGITERKIKETKKFQRMAYKAMINRELTDEFKKAVRQNIQDEIDMMPPERLEQIGDIESYKERQFKRKMQQMKMEWTRHYIQLDPAKYIKEIQTPALAFYAEADKQVAADTNSALMREYLDMAPTDDYKVQIIEAANHLFQQMKYPEGGGPGYARNQFVARFETVLGNWILERFKTPYKKEE